MSKARLAEALAEALAERDAARAERDQVHRDFFLVCRELRLVQESLECERWRRAGLPQPMATAAS